MAYRMLRVRATTKFHDHLPGDELLVQEDAEIASLVRNGYFEIIAIETNGDDSAVEAVAPTDAPVTPPAKPKRVAKGKTKAKAKKRV